MIYVLTTIVVLGEFFMLVEFGSVLMKMKEQNAVLNDIRRKIDEMDSGFSDVLNDNFNYLVQLKEFTDKIEIEPVEKKTKKKKTTKKSRSDLEGQNEFYDISE